MNSIAFATAAKYGPMLASNLAGNLHARNESVSLSGLENAFAGRPAIICGAGPTLDEQIPEIKRLQDSFQIIAVDMAGPALAYAGVRVDILCTLDVIAAKSEAIRQSNASLLVASTLAEPLLTKAFAGKIAFASTYVDKELGSEPFIGNFDNVAHLALAVSEYAGMGKVYLCGVDFCLADDLQVYAKNVVMADVQTAKYQTLPDNFLTVTCNDGQQRATWPSTPAYLKSLEQQISRRQAKTVQTGAKSATVDGTSFHSLPKVVGETRLAVPALADAQPIDINKMESRAVSGLAACLQIAEAADNHLQLPVSPNNSLIDALRSLQPQIEHEAAKRISAGEILIGSALPYAGLVPLLEAFLAGLRK